MNHARIEREADEAFVAFQKRWAQIASDAGEATSIEVWHHAWRAALAAADAALAAQGEPLAWGEIGESQSGRPMWVGISSEAPPNDYSFRFRPLYAAPVAAPAAQPLTDARIVDLWSWSASRDAERTASTQQHAFARAIERAHGITKEPA